MLRKGRMITMAQDTATLARPSVTALKDVPQIARKLVTEIPGPRSRALMEEHKQYVSAWRGRSDADICRKRVGVGDHRCGR
jgi:hypothetical protein